MMHADAMQSLADFDRDDLAAELARRGHRPSHARGILIEFYKSSGHIEVTRLRGSRALLADLSKDFSSLSSHLITRHVAGDGTIKLLVGFDRGGAVEAVLMPTGRDGIAAGCVSSQIGCAMGCDFCASTAGGLERNLEAGEIVEQFIHLKRAASETGRRLRTLVFMGMGEPLANFDNVVAAIRRIADPEMGALGWRQVTVSTVGLVPGIERLTEADLNVHLALSLHAPDDATRATIVPANRRYPVAEIVAAAKRYYERSGREVNVEYCLLGGVNDSDGHARMLAELLRGFRAHVNLIPYNPIGSPGLSGRVYLRPAEKRMLSFLALLREAGVVSHIRVTRGDDVSAACGQLRLHRGTGFQPVHS
jgi:23S rRNA (adenine2503-C2)-methyltransferase